MATTTHKEPLAPMELISDIRHFVGRHDELEALSAAARGSDGRVVVISGQPGVGKTALATRLAYDCSADYPDGQLFVELRGVTEKPVPPEAALAHVLHSFGAIDGHAVPAGDLAATYRSVLAAKRAIVVLDNAASEQQLRPLLPGASRCLLIITSRNPLSALHPDVAVALDVLNRPHAVDLLRGQSGNHDVDDDDPNVMAIVKACGGLPLALTIAADAGRRASWSLSTLARRLSDERNRLDELCVGDLAVRTSFQLSYGLLRRADRTLFRRIAHIPGATFDAALIAAASGLDDPRRVGRQMDRLVDLGLIVLAETEGRYRVHDLLRLFGTEQTQADGTPNEAEEIFNNVRKYLYGGAVRANAALAGFEVIEPNDAG